MMISWFRREWLNRFGGVRLGLRNNNSFTTKMCHLLILWR